MEPFVREYRGLNAEGEIAIKHHLRLLAGHLRVGAIALALSGCNSGSPTAPPVAPSPVPPPPASPQGTYTVSGIVSEVVGGQAVPLEGVHVEDSQRHVFVKTATDGAYAIRDVGAGAAYIYVMKDGFRSQAQQFMLTGNTRLDIQLVRQ